MKTTLLILALCSPAYAQIHQSAYISRANADTRYFNIPTEASAATMTGPLTLAGSSLTVTGNAFSVGGSTLVVSEGKVGIGMIPTSPFTSNINIEPVDADSSISFSGTRGFVGYDTSQNAMTIQSGAAHDIKLIAGTDYFGTTKDHVKISADGTFSVGGSTLVVSGGKVGVGISPVVAGSKLEVKGTTRNILFGDWTANTTYGAMSIGSGLGTDAHFISGGTSLIINRPTGADIDFRENNSAQMTIKTGGNVGIGDTAPTAKLVVNGNIVSSGTLTTNGIARIGRSGNPGQYMQLSNEGGAAQINIVADGEPEALLINNDGVEQLRLETDGDVVIQTTAAKLIMKSPDGTCSACGPDNSDVWSCSSVACP